MNKSEALRVLQAQLQPWRDRSWLDLRQEVGRSHHAEVAAESGTVYQVEVQLFWDDQPEGAIRVLGSIDDGGLRALMPLNQDFLVSPDGAALE